MSRIGKQPIPVPDGVQVQIEPEIVRVNGPRGELSERKSRDIVVEQQDGDIVVNTPYRPQRAPGTARADTFADREHDRGRHVGVREAA